MPLRILALVALLVSGGAPGLSSASANTANYPSDSAHLANPAGPGKNINYAQRIVALSPHSVELLFSIGAGDRIVGTVEYADFPAGAKQIPRIGNYHGIQIERVVSLKPDLIVAWKGGNKAADLNKLRSLGFRIFYTQPKNISEISTDLIALGELTGNRKQATARSRRLMDRYLDIKSRYRNRRPVRVFYQLWHDPFRTVGSGGWLNSLVSDCRGENVFLDAEGDYPQVSMEAVIAKNPEVIIVPHHPGNNSANSTARTDIWKTWGVVEAVRQERVFTINGDLLHRFSPRAVDGLALLCEMIDRGRQSDH